MLGIRGDLFGTSAVPRETTEDPYRVMFDQAIILEETFDDKPMESHPFYDRYQRGKVLGEGANGKVYTAIDKETGATVAMKYLFFQGTSTGECNALGELVSLQSLKGSRFVMQYIPYTIMHLYKVLGLLL
jgi:serine/threonine protein kinase